MSNSVTYVNFSEDEVEPIEACSQQQSVQINPELQAVIDAWDADQNPQTIHSDEIAEQNTKSLVNRLKSFFQRLFRKRTESEKQELKAKIKKYLKKYGIPALGLAVATSVGYSLYIKKGKKVRK